MKINYVDTSKLDVCYELEKSYNVILNEYLSFNFNFIENKSRDENYKLFEYGHKAGLYMAKMRDTGINWKNANFSTYKKSHSWYGMKVNNQNVWEGVLLTTKGKKKILKNTPLGDEFFKSTIDLLKIYSEVSSVMIAKLPSGRKLPAHRGDKSIKRIHLGLVVPEGDISFRVRGEDKKWKEGKCLAFNDFYEHEAWNNTDQDRINLIVDVVR
jgi:hypothetical protein